MSSYVSQLPFGLKNVNLQIIFTNDKICWLGVTELMKKPILVLGKSAKTPDEIDEGQKILCPARTFKRNADFRWNLVHMVVSARARLGVDKISIAAIINKDGKVGMAAWEDKYAE